MKIIPYVESNGVRSIPDNMMIDLFNRIKELGLIESLFFSGEIDTPEKFLLLAKAKSNVVNVVMDNNIIVYLAWLNDFGPNSAFAHFCAFPEVWGNGSVQIGKDIIKYWFDFEKDGEPILDVIIGRVPTVNRKAVHYIKKLGLTILGDIPLLAHGHDKTKRVGDTIAYITREQEKREQENG